MVGSIRFDTSSNSLMPSYSLSAVAVSYILLLAVVSRLSVLTPLPPIYFSSIIPVVQVD